MKNVVQLLLVCLIAVVVPSCKKDHSNPTGENPVGYDSDAKAFFTSSAISDTVQMNAVNDFVVALKKDSLWNKFIAIYPMVGGTAATTKWNLKDPRDADEAYRLTFYGTPAFSDSGILFPSIHDYADSHLIDTAMGGYNNSAISYYSTTQNAISGYDMGCADTSYPYNELSIYSNSADTTYGADNTEWFGYGPNLPTPNTTGLFMLSSTESNVSRYRNGIAVGSFGQPPRQAYTNTTIWIGTTRGASRDGKKQCALATIGNGLTDTQAMDFYNIVQTFETKLGR
jgi:hypothetical protein